ncbi:Hypothetical predicted protein, partial [Podarcis lilfordi]
SQNSAFLDEEFGCFEDLPPESQLKTNRRKSAVISYNMNSIKVPKNFSPELVPTGMICQPTAANGCQMSQTRLN